VHLGCGAFVGTLWPVTDEAALEFARTFYLFLAEGSPIGEAMTQSRLAVRMRRPNDPTWLAYCCFADPQARLRGGPRIRGLAEEEEQAWQAFMRRLREEEEEKTRREDEKRRGEEAGA
jgi:hypothetical protein